MFKTVSKYLFGSLFVLAGANHFLNAAFYLRIMPAYLPAPLLLVYLSGVCEIALGVLLLIPKFSRVAAWGLILLLIAVFPANVQMVAHAELYPEFDLIALWIRLFLQVVLVLWAYWLTLPASKRRAQTPARR